MPARKRPAEQVAETIGQSIKDAAAALTAFGLSAEEAETAIRGTLAAVAAPSIRGEIALALLGVVEPREA